MNVSIELSMYPLGREYIPEIKAFIARLKKDEQVECQVNGMSTQIFGEYRHVMQLLNDEMASTFEQDGKCVFVMKVINGHLKKES
jgi:uncharacterized protein YqgV (UPF0045/DUF77 family)